MLLEEEQGGAAVLGVAPSSEGKREPPSPSSEEEEDSTADSTEIVSPETPLFQSSSKTKLGSSGTDLMQLADEVAAREGAPEEEPFLPSLQLQTSSTSLMSGGGEQQAHIKRSSYLQDQFPLMDGTEEEEPLTLEDHSEHSNRHQKEEQQPLLSSPDGNITISSSGSEHPLLRQRRKTDQLSDLNKAVASHQQQQQHHRRNSSMLEREGGDYYPNPDDFPDTSKPTTTTPTTAANNNNTYSLKFTPHYTVTKYLEAISQTVMRSPQQYDPTAAATWIGFWAMFLVTCSNYVLMPMRDAIALAVGVEHIPKLTLASTVMALFSSVPIGWLFEAPDPQRRTMWKKLGITRGETQGTSLALFYRFFAMCLFSYAIGFKAIEFIVQVSASGNEEESQSWLVITIKLLLQHMGKVMYIAFFLVVHLMKLHSLSLVWGVTTEAMEYEENARKRHMAKTQPQSNGTAPHNNAKDPKAPTSKTRLQRLAFVGFGGTVGGILGR